MRPSRTHGPLSGPDSMRGKDLMTSDDTWTIQKLLNWVTEYLATKGIESPRFSAELLLSHVLALKRIELYTQFGKAVAAEQLGILRGLVKRAGLHEPVAY